MTLAQVTQPSWHMTGTRTQDLGLWMGRGHPPQSPYTVPFIQAHSTRTLVLISALPPTSH